MTDVKFDIIIVGAGCAGLSLAYQLSINPFFANQQILLIDKEQKNKQDRTWSFWDKGNNFFDEILHHQWPILSFFSVDYSTTENTHPYVYKMIKSEMFYAFCLGKINRSKNITCLQGDVESMVSNENETYIVVDKKKIIGTKIFSSILLEEPKLDAHHVYLLQHFKGWTIETTTPFFDPAKATLMDFTVHQKNGTTFVYVLPTSTNVAMIEYTIFSEQLLDDSVYDSEIEQYILEKLNIKNYSITEKEFGVIPMTDFKFIHQQNQIYFIGTAGGATKASSGYTFTFIQKQVTSIVKQLINNLPVNTNIQAPRFRFYDKVLLHIMKKNTLPTDQIFARLFKRNGFQLIFDFLHNETTIWEDIKIMNSTKKGPFLIQALKLLSKWNK